MEEDNFVWPTSMEEDAVKWPTVNDTLLIVRKSTEQEPFYLPDTHSVRGKEDAAHSYSAGFKKAAEVILHELQETPHEILIFPYIFLWHHHLELSIKNLVFLVSRTQGDEPLKLEGYNLSTLWGTLSRHLQEDSRKDEELNAAVLATSQIIKQFEKLDPESWGSRYPEPRQSGKSKTQDDSAEPLIKHLSALPRHFDYNHFAQILNKVCCLIDCLQLEFSNRLSNKAD